MTLYVDAMLSPSLARWLVESFEVEAVSALRLGLLDAADPDIADAARRAGAVMLTKDEDFVIEARRRGSPPVIWIRGGNTSTAALRKALAERLPTALERIRRGEIVVELPR